MTGRGAAPDEARLCELLLDDSAAAAGELERLAVDPRTAAEIARLGDFLERVRALGIADERERAESGRPGSAERAAFVSRVLDCTTREDLSWRGDLRLVGRFVAEGLRSSVLLRVTAASLVLHLAAVPVVAWVIWSGRAPEPHFYTGIEPGAEDPFREELPEPRHDAPPEGDALDAHVAEPIAVTPDQLWRAATRNALRVDRWCLANGALPAPGAERPDEPILELLWYRASEAAGGERWSSGTLDTARTGPERALLLELLLDRCARGQDPDAAERARRLAAADDPAGGRLLEAARARARAYGLGDAPVSPAGEAAFDPVRHALCGRDDARWRADLRGALAERGLSGHPAAAPWLTTD